MVIRCCVSLLPILSAASAARICWGRIGGDEFAVLMCDITSMENALVKAGQICSLYTKGAAKEGLKISCSIGMVFCESDDGAAFDDLYQKADSALYKAKEKGKNVFVVFDENML